MGMGPRKRDNDVRDSIGKIVNPPSVGKPTKNQNNGVKGDGNMSPKQYFQTGKKYNGPNYPTNNVGVKTGGSV